jgi:succinyl-diaminopimelate desuccinylase
MRQKLDDWVDAHRDEIVAQTQAILRIPSVEDSASVGRNTPFGKPVADALEHTLFLCTSLGMATENFGGYAGHAEFGAGEEIVAMLGHLDVVPAGKGWTHAPWDGEVADGWLWGRGSSDDKGPTYAALFGAKAVLDVSQAEGITLTRRIRLIFGCDEESGWQCMKHYFGAAGQPKPTVAFTPDASFPLVYAEKGSFTGVARKMVEPDGARLRIARFQSGLRPNMVPDEAEAILEGDADARASAAKHLEALPDIGVETLNGVLTVCAQGRSAHGSTPQEGDNAAIKLMRILTSSAAALTDLSPEDRAWMIDLARRGEPTGANLGIGGSDDITGPLTSNLGIVTLEDGVAEAKFNIRYPATWESEMVLGRFQVSLSETGWQIPELSHTPSLYVPQDQEPVRTLLRVYREHTGDMRPPTTIGGRTYATTVAPIGVAYGAAMEGDPDVAHQADERFAVERLIQCAKIYALALYELAK